MAEHDDQQATWLDDAIREFRAASLPKGPVPSSLSFEALIERANAEGEASHDVEADDEPLAFGIDAYELGIAYLQQGALDRAERWLRCAERSGLGEASDKLADLAALREALTGLEMVGDQAGVPDRRELQSNGRMAAEIGKRESAADERERILEAAREEARQLIEDAQRQAAQILASAKAQSAPAPRPQPWGDAEGTLARTWAHLTTERLRTTSTVFAGSGRGKTTLINRLLQERFLNQGLLIVGSHNRVLDAYSSTRVRAVWQPTTEFSTARLALRFMWPSVVTAGQSDQTAYQNSACADRELFKRVLLAVRSYTDCARFRDVTSARCGEALRNVSQPCLVLRESLEEAREFLMNTAADRSPGRVVEDPLFLEEIWGELIG